VLSEPIHPLDASEQADGGLGRSSAGERDALPSRKRADASPRTAIPPAHRRLADASSMDTGHAVQPNHAVTRLSSKLLSPACRRLADVRSMDRARAPCALASLSQGCLVKEAPRGLWCRGCVAVLTLVLSPG
jgi:hypothetical protein